MVPSEAKEKFLADLCDMPIVSIVCKRHHIAKSTIYRWKAEDKEFAKRMDDALSKGRYSVNDLAESKLISMIKKESPFAIRMWLESNDTRYRKPRKPIAAPAPERVIKTVEIRVVHADGSRSEAYPRKRKKLKVLKVVRRAGEPIPSP